MNPEDFRAPEAGRVVRTPGGFFAFVPAPLPPRIVYDEGLARLLSRADAALGELSAMGRQLPNPHLLISSYVRREAVLSSRIEGTKASLADILLDETGVQQAPRENSDVPEVRNYVEALEYGIRRLSRLPLSLRLVREIHKRLMHGVRGGRATPGDFRRSQNWIGPAGSTPSTTPYVPPPIDELDGCLGRWEKFLHVRDKMPDLIQCALIHEQFEAIHPFLDGNGRVGRLLVTLFLIERGRLAQPLLYLSEYIEANKQGYYEALQRVRTRGDWSGWLRYFLVGVNETARSAVRKAARLMDLRESLRRRLSARRNAVRLIDELFVNPYVTVRRAAELLGVTYPTAKVAVDALLRARVLFKVTPREWGRVYLARPILTAIERAE
jgi:Fic family protein